MFDWGPELRARLSSLRLSPAREAEILEELSQHLDDRRRELIAGGVTPAEASRMMLDEFHADRLVRYLGPLRQSRSAEVAPPARGRFLLGGCLGDLRHAVRELRAAPGFTVGALVVLTLGIGATTAIFSVVDAVALRALPFDEHDRLVAVGERRPPGPLDTNSDPHALMSIAAPNYLDWVAEQRVFESIAAIVGAPISSFTLKAPGRSLRMFRGYGLPRGSSMSSASDPPLDVHSPPTTRSMVGTGWSSSATACGGADSAELQTLSGGPLRSTSELMRSSGSCRLR